MGSQASLAQTADGEVILTPAAGNEFFGALLPADWSMTPWNPGGSATVSAGVLTVDGARAGTTAAYPVGRSLEFVATFTGAAYQHVGFGETFDAAPWAIFSTFAGGGLFARTAWAAPASTRRSPAPCSGRRIASASTGRRPA